MPEQNNDRIEQFFKKAAARADISFNEEDWKKLEARLDAADELKAAGPNRAGKITGAAIMGAVLIATTVWLSATYDFPGSGANSSSESIQHSGTPSPSPSEMRKPTEEQTSAKEHRVSESEEKRVAENEKQSIIHDRESGNLDATEKQTPKTGNQVPERHGQETDAENTNHDVARHRVAKIIENEISGDVGPADNPSAMRASHVGTGLKDLPVRIQNDKIERELVGILPASAERNKQKAVVELPGAEEEQTREVDAMVEEEHASDQTKHVATPRLSLLLSFAPDFSGTSMGFYSAPGKAYGVTLHYHPFARWSISAGVIKNHKVYTGDGEDYHPPKGYWKYYTNGVIPETVDGSCSILEFPIMLQYTIHNSGKHKWLAGLGASSYLMQSESYRYNFASPNPGAKEGWDSKRSSRFMFNMVNITIGYERRVLPGLMLGVEPYAKIPLEEIGWSNLRLFSTGASITLRYTILQKKMLSLPQGRAPD